MQQGMGCCRTQSWSSLGVPFPHSSESPPGYRSHPRHYRTPSPVIGVSPSHSASRALSTRGPAAPPAGRSAAVRPERPGAPGHGQKPPHLRRTPHCRHTCTSAKTPQHPFLSLTAVAFHRPSHSTPLLWVGTPSNRPGCSKPHLT